VCWVTLFCNTSQNKETKTRRIGYKSMTWKILNDKYKLSIKCIDLILKIKKNHTFEAKKLYKGEGRKFSIKTIH
jgi:hypothetical protein